MKAKIYNQFIEKIKVDDIETLEFHIAQNLPESFKRFLLKSNGGRPEPNGFKADDKSVVSQVQFFFGITNQSIYDLKMNFDKWKLNSLPVNYLPIAIDVAGNLIVIDLSNDNENLFLWIHDSLEIELLLIDCKFEKFLSGFFKIDIEQPEVDLAIERQDRKYFENRIYNGEDIDEILNDFGQRVVVVAALKNKVRLLKYFSSKGANMSMTLFSAASNGHLEALKYLLSLKLDVDERGISQNDDTPLIQASFGGYLEIVKELIKAGADINARDKFNQTVLNKALWSNNDEVVLYLESQGAK